MERHAFALEQLEGRAFLSVAVPLAAAPVAATASLLPAVHAQVNTATPLTGAFNVAGTYTQPFGNPDAGAKYHLTGSGKKKSLGGNFTLSGDLQGPGFVASGQTTGYLTITTSRGTLKLKVQGPPQSPGSFPPSLFFRIVSGTGSYAHSAGKGHIAVSASSSTHKFLFKFNQLT